MRVLDDANLQLKAGKCKIAQESIEWLGFKLTRTGTYPADWQYKVARFKR